MSYPAIQVTKIGGSLLNLPDLPARWRQWRSQRETVHDVVVVGGGPLVDVLRERGLHRSIGDDIAHWSAVDLMAINTRLLASQLAEYPVCAVGPVLEDRLRTVGGTFVDVVHFLRHVEPLQPGSKLESSWDVTSDSIAAWLAEVWHAELWLLKSVPPGATPAAHVDKWFGQASRALPGLIWVNMRASEPESVQLTLPLAAATK